MPLMLIKMEGSRHMTWQILMCPSSWTKFPALSSSSTVHLQAQRHFCFELSTGNLGINRGEPAPAACMW